MKSTSILLIVALLLVTVAGTAFADTNYCVEKGDNLYNIGKRVGVHHNYIMAANDLGNATIYPGQILNIPDQDEIHYLVQKGDNLYKISRKYKVSVQRIIEDNKLDNNIIFPGQRLIIPLAKGKRSEPVMGKSVSSIITSEDIELLAKLINAEARGEGYRGQLAVGAVILNRLASDKFPNSLREVIYQRTKGGYQFSPVGDGSINLPPSPSALKAAKEAIKGEDPTEGALFFYNPQLSTDNWIKTLPVTKVIGNHVFAR